MAPQSLSRQIILLLWIQFSGPSLPSSGLSPQSWSPGANLKTGPGCTVPRPLHGLGSHPAPPTSSSLWARVPHSALATVATGLTDAAEDTGKRLRTSYPLPLLPPRPPWAPWGKVKGSTRRGGRRRQPRMPPAAAGWLWELGLQLK